MSISIHEFLRRHKLTQSEQDQLAYMPQSVKLEEAANPHLVRITMIVISSAILVFFIWAGFTNISEITRANGEVVPRGYTQVIQHFDGALVKEILVNDGDIVEIGQTLITLEDSEATQNLAEINAKRDSVLMHIEREKAFLQNRNLNFTNVSELTKEQKDFQLRAFKEKQDALENERDVLRKQMSQKNSEMIKFEHRKKRLTKSLRLTSEAMEIQKKLLDKGYASRLTYIKYEQDHHNTLGDLQETIEALIQAKSVLNEYEFRISSMDNRARDDSYTLLDSLQNELSQLNENLINLQDRVRRLTLISPVHGIVKGLTLNTIGGVVEPGKALLEIVPLSAKLIVEAQVLPRDIGHVKVGQSIRVKVSSYDFSRYGTVTGTLDYVSATTFLNRKGEPYYKVRIGLSNIYVGNDHNRNKILPGMTVVGDIITGEKTILSYLFKPIHLSLKTAFSER